MGASAAWKGQRCDGLVFTQVSGAVNNVKLSHSGMEGVDMRAWIFSDLQLPPGGSLTMTRVPAADVCICAGNVSSAGMAAGIEWLGLAVCPHMPVVYVPGNRDYRGPSIPEVMERSRFEAAAFPSLHILDEEEVVLGGGPICRSDPLVGPESLR